MLLHLSESKDIKVVMKAQMMKIRVVIIVLKPDPARDPANPGLEPSRVEEKTREGKTRCDPVDPATWLTRQDPVANPLTFVFLFFLLKRSRFDLKKTDPVKTRNPSLGPDRIFKLWLLQQP
jgi:hypothetical protein